MNQKENLKPQDELKFPMKFDKCPVCGSTKRIAETLRDEEAAKGKVPKDCLMVVLQAVTPITEMKTIMLGLSIVPLLTCQIDICADCGTLYSIAVHKQDIPTGELQKMMGIAPQPRPIPPLGPQIFNRQQRRHPS